MEVKFNMEMIWDVWLREIGEFFVRVWEYIIGLF